MYQIKIYNSIEEIKKEVWDLLTENNVYMCYEYLKTIEETTVFPLLPYYIIVYGEKALAGSVTYFEPQNSSKILDSVLLGRLMESGSFKKATFLPSIICNRQRGEGTHFIFSPDINNDQLNLLQDKLIDEIERIAKKKKASVCFLNITNDQEFLMKSLKKRGFYKTIDLPSNSIDVAWSSFDGYIKYLSIKYPYMKKSIRHEMNRNRKSGVIIKQIQNFEKHEKRLFELMKLNHFKHNSSAFMLKDNYIQKIKENFGENAIVYTAVKNDIIIGVSIILKKGREAFFSSIGIDHELSEKDFTFFNLGYYEPIREMSGYNLKRIYYGRGLYDTKIKRGCTTKDMFLFYKPRNKLALPFVKIWFIFHKKWMAYKLSYIKKI